MVETALALQATAHEVPLLVIFDGTTGRPIRVDRDRLTIGRESSCDIVVYDASVAPRHAMLQRQGETFEVFNLGAAASCTRNGAPFEAVEIRSGDELRLGVVRAVFLDPKADILPAGMQLWFHHPELASQYVPETSPPTKQVREPDEFDRLLLDAVRRAPWYLISMLVHALLYALIVFGFEEPPVIARHKTTIEAEVLGSEDVFAETDEVDEPIEEPELEPIEPTEEVFDSPIPDDIVDRGDASDYEEAPPDGGIPFLGMGKGAGKDDGRLGGAKGSGADLGRLGGGTRQQVENLRASGLDVVFVLDATGSMDSEITSAKRQIGDMIVLLETFGLRFRMGVVAFRDKGDEYVVRSQDLTPYAFRAVDYLDSVFAYGGGDTPEAVYEAIQAAAGMRWSQRAKKLIVLVGDAPPHENRLRSTEDICSRFASRQGQVHTLLAENNISGADLADARQAYSKLASAGKGRMTPLGPDLRIMEDILMLALASDDRDEIRRLLKDVTTGWKGKFIRDRIEENDIPFLTQELSSESMKPITPRELIRANRRELIPVYLAALNDPKTPLRNRWLATVLLRRIVSDIGRRHRLSDAIRKSLAEFDPEAAEATRNRHLQVIGKGLLEVGILEDR